MGQNGSVYLCGPRRDGSVVSVAGVGGERTILGAATSLYIDRCTSIVLDDGGRLYVGGNTNGTTRAGIARYNADGSQDFETWGEPGSGVVSPPDAAGMTLARRLVLRADGKMIVATQAVVGGRNSFGIWRVNKDGTTDTTFAPPNGYVVKTIAQSDVVVGAIAVDAENRIVVAGGNGEMVAARFWQ